MIPASARPRSSSGRASRLDVSRYVAICLLSLSACTCNDLGGPEAQLTRAAHALQDTRVIPLAAGEIRVTRLQVSRITPEPELHPPRVVFQVDLEGTLSAGPRLSVLGLERQPMVFREGRYQPLGPLLPALQAALANLPAAPATRLLMRLELDRALVTAERADGSRQSLTVPLPHLSPDAGPR